MLKTTTYLEVQFYDLDPMNIVWHGNYIKYLEQARCEMFNKIGYSYMDMYNDGVMYPIAKMEMKFIKSATFGQKIVVKAILDSIEPSLDIRYEIKDSVTGEMLFKAKTMQIGVDFHSKTSIYEAPERFRKGIECLNI